jgi:hypothetical protein
MTQYYLKLNFTDDQELVTSKAIRRVTGGPSHVSVSVFEIADNGQHSRYYFESIGKRDKDTCKTGVRGPIPLTHLEEWLSDKPETRRLQMVPNHGYLPLTPAEADFAVKNMRDAVPTIHYAHLQLGGNLLARFGVRVTFGNGSPLTMTCCELPVRTRVLPSRFWAALGLDNVNADELWPGGSSRYSLMAGAQRVVREFGEIFP